MLFEFEPLEKVGCLSSGLGWGVLSRWDGGCPLTWPALLPEGLCVYLLQGCHFPFSIACFPA